MCQAPLTPCVCTKLDHRFLTKLKMDPNGVHFFTVIKQEMAPVGAISSTVPKAGLEPALREEKHFECSASAISPLRLALT